DARIAAVAPVPSVGGEVRAQWSARARGSMAPGAGRAAYLTAINALAQHHHVAGRAFRHGQGRRVAGGAGIRTLGRLRLSDADGAGRGGGTRAGNSAPGICRRGGIGASRGTATVDDAIDSSAHVVGDIQRSVGTHRETRGTMRGLVGRSLRPGEPIGEYLALAGRLAAGQSLIDDVVASLRIRRPIPRAVECNEYAVAVVGWKFLLVVERHAVRRPMRGKRGDRR